MNYFVVDWCRKEENTLVRCQCKMTSSVEDYPNVSTAFVSSKSERTEESEEETSKSSPGAPLDTAEEHTDGRSKKLERLRSKRSTASPLKSSPFSFSISSLLSRPPMTTCFGRFSRAEVTSEMTQEDRHWRKMKGKRKSEEEKDSGTQENGIASARRKYHQLHYISYISISYNRPNYL